MSLVSYGFREVLQDSRSKGKWMDVDLQIGTGHSTFQGTKFSDFAGGFSYRSSPTLRPILQNRMIYWRTLNDVLELIETSLDYNLHDNQVRFIFQDSPIVGPITIQETEQHVFILVATVTTVSRFIFTHPRLVCTDEKFLKNNQPSIFNQILQKPAVNIRNFSIVENSFNVPVPTSAASIVLPHTGDCIFALSYDSGSQTVVRVSKQDIVNVFDLRQSNVFARIISGFTHTMFNRSPQSATDAAIGLSFFTVKSGREIPFLFLVTLSMNGHFRLWVCNDSSTFQDWSMHSDIMVDQKFALEGLINCNMVLRRSSDDDSQNLPTYSVFIPGTGFKFYRLEKSSEPQPTPVPRLIIREIQVIILKDRDIMDFTITPEYLFVLVSNPEEETDWQVKSFKLTDSLNPRFNLALLEPLPCQDVQIYPTSLDPKAFYSDLIFNKSCFSSSTIYQALGMFQNTSSFQTTDSDWEQMKQFAQNVIDYEIRLRIAAEETNIADDDYYELSFGFWLAFYNSCVEYHILTIKPLGIFFDKNTGMLGIVKKSRISFLRPTDFLETLYYFPHIALPPDQSDSDSGDSEEHLSELAIIIKFMEMIELIESTTDDMHRKKIDKQLRVDRTKVTEVCAVIANLLTQADPHSELMERRHFLPALENKLREIQGAGQQALQHTLSLVASWNDNTETLAVEGIDDRIEVPEFFMASRTGANITYLVLKQLIQHRYMISRNILLLHSLMVNYFNNLEDERVRIHPTLDDAINAQMSCHNYFQLLQMVERNAEIISDVVIDRGVKVANLMRSNTSDHLIRGKLLDPTPMKLLEKFCDSNFGNMSVRNRIVGRKNCAVLAFADAAGKVIWPSESGRDHPFEEFFISHCQYAALNEYANLLTTHLRTGRASTQKFYRGLAALCDGEEVRARMHFESVSFTESGVDSYFRQKILSLLPEQEFSPLVFYQKVIGLFQVFGDLSSVQELARKALRVCDAQKSKIMMASLAFKCALEMTDFQAAYGFILSIPSVDAVNPAIEIGEKMASVRTFVSRILELSDVETLLAINFDDTFSPGVTARQKVEEILDAHANLSDPLSTHGVYPMLYAYHINRDNYYEAAQAMYSRAMRIGEKGGDLQALKLQRDSYLDVLACLSCLADRQTPLKIQRIGLHARKEGAAKIPGKYMKQEDVYKTYDDIAKELEVCLSYIRLSKIVPPSPIRPEDFQRRAAEVVDNLVAAHYYDNAIKIATMWNLPYSPIVTAFATVCCKLVYDIPPASGDPLDYIKNNDSSNLPISNTSITEIAFRLLENYLKNLEKPKDSSLHRDVTIEILAHGIALPRWLLDSYKKVNVSQLIHCYVRFGDWEEATVIATKVIDAALGRVMTNEFDPSIHKIDAFEPIPVIPYTVIDMLAHQMELRYEIDSDPEKERLLRTLQTHINDYIIRVMDTRKERACFFREVP